MDFGAQLERLRQLQRERDERAGKNAPAPPQGSEPATAAFDPVESLDLTAIDTPNGTAYAHHRTYPLSFAHGHCALASAGGVSETAWRLLGGAKGSDGADPLTEAAFIDVETTGLAGGTGVVAFLVGVARIVDGQVVMRQFFLRDFGEEAAMLAAVDGALAGAQTIISYNGKIFDWPLLETRCVMNRMRFSARVDGHIDLVFPARRIWQHHLPDRRLATVELSILGHERQGDIPGELIPALYFGYQRSGDARPLQPVLEHNRLDILSLIGLLGVIGGALSDPFAGSLRHGSEFHGLGRWCLDLGLIDDGVRCLEQASRSELPQGARERVLKDLAATYKRLKQRQNAVAVWRQLVADGALSAFPYVELAKHHEHAERDYRQALELVERAVELQLGRTRLGSGSDARELQDLLHRRERLRRKLDGTATK